MLLADQLRACRACLLADADRRDPAPTFPPAAVPDAQHPACTLFFSLTDGERRAQVVHASADSFEAAWEAGAAQTLRLRDADKTDRGLWLRVDQVDAVQPLQWQQLQAQLALVKRNYFRRGIALQPDFQIAFMEQELNANAMLYGGSTFAHAVVNPHNFALYGQARFGTALAVQDFAPDRMVWTFGTRGVFCGSDGVAHMLAAGGADTGRRAGGPLTGPAVKAMVAHGSSHLARQVEPDGRFVYGWFPCFDRRIAAYNALRHASTVYSMIEAWQLTRDDALKEAIDRALAYLCGALIQTHVLPDGQQAAFLVDEGGEIKLGGNAVCLLALSEYSRATGTTALHPLLERLAVGILHMQHPATGAFVHVLNASDLSLKQDFRIVYYDGEAAFGLMRLYELTQDGRWLAAVERAFDHFIAQEYWQVHDHWLAYCVEALTRHRPEERYFRFGLQNVVGHLDFVLERQTTFPTLLELMMATRLLVARLAGLPHLRHLLAVLDADKFLRALHHRANYLQNGFFWPEMAMYFRKPSRIAGAFFIRHQAFRVRIDDVEHYLSGLVAYHRLLQSQAHGLPAWESGCSTATGPCGVVAWGGDVNLGRRQHYRQRELGGPAAMLGTLAVLRQADLRIVNLECVVATGGTPGIDKGERGPYYYRARPEMLAVLTEARVDIVATGNNHSGDYGPDALLEQQALLLAAGIAQAGSGRDREDALAPALRRAGGVRVAMFSVDSTQPLFAAGDGHAGTAYLSLEDPSAWTAELAPRIAAARLHADVVLVAVHWGANLEAVPSSAEVAVGHAIVDAGADAVLGASSHVLQGIEVYRGRPILHDAGDLLFDSLQPGLAEAGVFSLELSTRGVERVLFTPIGVGCGFSQQFDGERALSAAARFAEKCLAMGTVVALTPQGLATVALAPPTRPALPEAPAAAVRPVQAVAALAAVPVLRPEWRVESVPADARVCPLQMGPLRLLGVRCIPRQVVGRQMLWVESFWTADAPLAEDVRLQFRALPMRSLTMPAWGENMDHDPCDWMWPTSRWEPGRIYRDYYGLRPPRAGLLDDDVLQLEVRLLGSANNPVARRLPLWCGVRLPGAVPLPDLPPLAASVPASASAPLLTTPVWTADQLQRATGGRWLVAPPPGWSVQSVVRTTRHLDLLPGPAMYVASDYRTLAMHENYSSVRGADWDRHRELPAFQPLLAGAIVQHPVEGLDPSFPLLQVADPIGALVALGTAARNRFRGRVVGITGTAGKSSTVALLRSLLPATARVVATVDNCNSRVGVPATLAQLAADADVCILEMAQSALWMDRGPVSLQARPHVAVITEVDLSQPERAATLEQTAEYKSRIFLGLEPGGIAIVAEHVPYLAQIVRAAERTAAEVWVVGSGPNANVRVLDARPVEGGCRIRLALRGRVLDYVFPIADADLARHSALAIAALVALGFDAAEACARMATMRLPASALQAQEMHTRSGICATVIDDSWNAGAASVRNAMDFTRGYQSVNGQRIQRRIAILGRLARTGQDAAALHRNLAAPLLASGIEHLITHGDDIGWLRDEVPQRLLGPHFRNAPPLVRYLGSFMRDGDLVLVKGDRVHSDFGDIPQLLRQL